jgi:hypothetical protein
MRVLIVRSPPGTFGAATASNVDVAQGYSEDISLATGLQG